MLLISLDWKTEKLGVYDGIGFTAMLFIIAVVSWLSNREIERSLKRARGSEAALRAERDSLELKVEARTKELRQAQLHRIFELHHLAESGKLAAGFFHELMNPLTALTLAVENLKPKRNHATGELEEQVNKALQASHRVGEFITAIQRQTTIPTEPQLLDIKTELQNIIKLLGYKARKNNLVLQSQLSPGTELFVSPVDFHHVAHNLIDFALEAAKNLATTHKRTITVDLQQQPKYIWLQITYPGSDAPILNQTTSLGLTIAQEALIRLGGSFTIQNFPNQTIILRAQFPH